MVKYFGLVRSVDGEEIVEVEADSFKSGVKKLRSETFKTLERLGLQDKEFKGLISFATDKETLLGYAGSNKPTSAKAVDDGLVRLVKLEYLAPLNLELFGLRKPLIVLPSIDILRPGYPKLENPEEIMVEHVEHYEKLSRKVKEKTLLPDVNSYTERYDIVPYTVVVSWGFMLRDLLRNNGKAVDLSTDEFLTVAAFADVAANMVHSKIWSPSRDGRFPSSAKTLNFEELVEAFHSYVATVVEEPVKVPYLEK